jgi:carbamoyl-phosphate synthase large subunit
VDVVIPGVMEHIERAGVHSGDSIAVYPGVNLSRWEVDTIVDYTHRIGIGLNVRGLMNVQYVIFQGEVYVLEVNPRSSRTVPFLSKVTGVPMVRLATNVILGKSLRDQGYSSGLCPKQKLFAIKAPVFSMSKLVGVDTYLGPEMKSTGEVMGIDHEFIPALTKCLMASNVMLPPTGRLLLSIANGDKAESMPLVRRLAALGYEFCATEGTAAMIESALGLSVMMTPKRLNEGHPNVLDVIVDGTVNGVVNTLTGGRSVLADGFHIRRAAAERGIPCFTSLDTLRAVVESLEGGSEFSVSPMHVYLRGRTAVDA